MINAIPWVAFSTVLPRASQAHTPQTQDSAEDPDVNNNGHACAGIATLTLK
jgi:hypothetical protein